MMVPVLYCTCILSIIAATFVLFVGLRLWQHRVKKQPFRAHTKETQDEEEVRPASHTASAHASPCLGFEPPDKHGVISIVLIDRHDSG